jgi:hypothetical protein
MSSLDEQISKNLSSPRAKKFSLFLSGKSVALEGRPASNEGRIMIVIYARRDAVDATVSSRAFARGRTTLKRTAKSCGPDAPLLASSSWEANASQG